MLVSGNHAAERRKAVVHAIDRAATGVGGDGGEERAFGDAVANFLAFHVAARRGRRAGLRRAVNQRMRVRLGPVARRESRREEHKHGRKHGPAMARRAGHAAQRVGEAGGDDEDRKDLQKV